MALAVQAQYLSGHVTIHCDDRWDCCQREQAANKAAAWNRELNTPPPKFIRTAAQMKALTKAKGNCTSAANRAFDSGTPAQRAKAAKDAGAAPCMVEKIENGGTRSDLRIQMDHPLDVKVGGAASGIAMVPLDAAVNGAFGSVAKNLGGQMLREGSTQVASISLVCPPSSGCPKEEHSHGEPRHGPPTPGATTSYVRKKVK